MYPAVHRDRTNNKILSWMRFVCRLIYWCGLGDCWYESTVRSVTHRYAYAIYTCFSNAFALLIILSEMAVLPKTNLTEEERNDNIMFCIAHPLIVLKWLFIAIHKQRIKELLKRLLVTTRELYSEELVDREQLRKSRLYCCGLAASIYFGITLTIANGVIEYYKTGTPWRTIITFYPEREDSSWTAYAVRTMTTYYLIHNLTCMLATDLLAVNCLILVAFKFKTLQLFFKSLHKKHKMNLLIKSATELENDMHQGFVKGLYLHTEILWCARNTQKCLGNVYSFQVLQSMSMFIVLLVKLVTSNHILPYLIASLSVIICLLILTGVYMWNAGEITYEAAMVCDAMFQSGWHVCSARARMRKLVVVGIIRSQVPVVMTAFGVVDMSYTNFLKIVKNSYSNFAVLY